MIIETFITWAFILNCVSAPPPLRVELAAEKENAKEQLNIREKFQDFITDRDDKDSNIHILENDADDILDSNDAETVDDLEPIYLPNDFVNYDLNGDRSIDINELAAVTGAKENIEQAFNASDTDGDGKISETEFNTGPLNFDFHKDIENGTFISESIEIDDIEDTDENLRDADNWENPADENKIGTLYRDDEKISNEKFENLDTVILRNDYIDSVTDGLTSNGDELKDNDNITNDEESDNGDEEEEDEDQHDDDIYDGDDEKTDDEDEETDEDDFDDNGNDNKTGNVAFVDDNDKDDSDDDKIDNDDRTEDNDMDDDRENENDMDSNNEDDDDDDDDDEHGSENDRDEDDLDEDVDLGNSIDNASSTENDKLNTTKDTGDGDVIEDKYDADDVNVSHNKTQ